MLHQYNLQMCASEEDQTVAKSLRTRTTKNAADPDYTGEGECDKAKLDAIVHSAATRDETPAGRKRRQSEIRCMSEEEVSKGDRSNGRKEEKKKLIYLSKQVFNLIKQEKVMNGTTVSCIWLLYRSQITSSTTSRTSDSYSSALNIATEEGGVQERSTESLRRAERADGSGTGHQGEAGRHSL